MNAHERILEIKLSWKQGEISEKQFVEAIQDLLNEPRETWYYIFDILKEIKDADQSAFVSSLDYIFNNLRPANKEVGPYPFSDIFRKINRFLLEQLNTQDRDFLLPYIHHKHTVVRAIVANCLIEWGDADAFSILEESLLTEKNAQIDIANLYSERVKPPMSDAQIQRLMKAIRQSGNLTRMTLVGVCAELQDTRLIPILIDLLKDYQEPWHKWGSFDPICYQAASILEEMNTPDALEALAHWREKEYQRLKREISKGKSYHYAPKLGDPRLILVLAKAIQITRDVDEELYAMYALVNFHHNDTIDILTQFIRDWRTKKRIHREHKVVPTPPYVASTHRGYRVLWEAIKALGQMKAESSVDVISDLIQWEHHPDELMQTREISFHALRLIGTPTAQDVLKSMDA